MTPEEARETLEQIWTEGTNRGRAMKDPYVSIDAVQDFVARSSGDDRPVYEEVIVSWLSSGDDRKLYDALALISELEIGEALPEMKKLRRRLRLRPWAKDDLEMVDNTIRELETSR